MVQQAEDVRGAIDRANARFVEAYNRGDVVGASGVYTEDATILPPGNARIRGRDEIQKFWQATMDAGVLGVTLQTDDLEISGDLASEIGTATLRIRGEGGQESTVTAKFVVVWKRDADGWRWHTDIWNTDE